jgi:hypothetical protein
MSKGLRKWNYLIQNKNYFLFTINPSTMTYNIIQIYTVDIAMSSFLIVIQGLIHCSLEVECYANFCNLIVKITIKTNIYMYTYKLLRCPTYKMNTWNLLHRLRMLSATQSPLCALIFSMIILLKSVSSFYLLFHHLNGASFPSVPNPQT